MATYSTYDSVGQAEDVSDVISNITPTDTPFLSSIGTDKCDAKMFEWQEDSLGTPATNAHIEGADFTDATLPPTTMRKNYTQILEKTVKISATSDAVKTYGRAKETAYQIAKKLKELKLDQEFAYVGSANDAVVGNSSTTAREMGNVFGNDPDGNAIIHADLVDDNAATPRALTEALVLSTLQTCYTEGGDPTIMMIKPADSLIVADFAKAAGRERDFGAGKGIVNVVNLYVSPFGEVKVVMNRHMLSTEALFYNPSNWRKVTLRPFKRTMLAKTGDADKHNIVGEISLKHMNYKATGRITDLS